MTKKQDTFKKQNHIPEDKVIRLDRFFAINMNNRRVLVFDTSDTNVIFNELIKCFEEQY